MVRGRRPLYRVAGTDVSLSTLSEQVVNARPFGTGKVMLLFQDMKWLVGDRTDMMKPYEGDPKDRIENSMGGEQPFEIASVSNDHGEFKRFAYVPITESLSASSCSR